MGEPKQLIDVGGKPMLLGVLETILATDVEHVILVTNSHVRAALNLPKTDRLALEINDDESTEMIDSVRLAIRAASHRFTTQPADGWLVCPSDLPDLVKDHVATCISAFRAQPNRIVVAARGGRRGHPIIFPASHVAFVESNACDAGLNALPRKFPDVVLEFECQSDGILRDVDTPDDLNERDARP